MIAILMRKKSKKTENQSRTRSFLKQTPTYKLREMMLMKLIGIKAIN